MTVAALRDGTLALLGANADLAAEWRRDADGRLVGRPHEVARRARARLWRSDGATLEDGPGFALETPHPLVARFSDGRWLIADPRSRDAPNGRLLAADGRDLGRLQLGDAIEQLWIDDADRIWVGWFDEGVFGNQTRLLPDAPERSAVVVACFEGDGTMLPIGPFPPQAGVPADAYALTVVGGGAWACPYTDFPLLRLCPGRPVRWWRNGLAGAKAIAVAGSHVVLAGGYGAEADRLALLALPGRGAGEEAAALATWRLPLRPAPPSEPGDPAWRPDWHAPALLAGCGDLLHLVDDGEWRRWRVADLVAAVPEVSG